MGLRRFELNAYICWDTVRARRSQLIQHLQQGNTGLHCMTCSLFQFLLFVVALWFPQRHFRSELSTNYKHWALQDLMPLGGRKLGRRERLASVARKRNWDSIGQHEVQTVGSIRMKAVIAIILPEP